MPGNYLNNKACVACAATTTAACNSECTTAGFVTSGATCVACAASSTAACNSGCTS